MQRNLRTAFCSRDSAQQACGNAAWLAKGATNTGPMGPGKTIEALRNYIAVFLDTHLGEPFDPLLTGPSSDYPTLPYPRRSNYCAAKPSTINLHTPHGVAPKNSIVPFENVPAEESASQDQKRFMDVGPLFVANTKAAKLIKPRESPFNHPAPSAQSAAMFGVALGEPRHDVADKQTSPDRLGVITTVA